MTIPPLWETHIEELLVSILSGNEFSALGYCEGLAVARSVLCDEAISSLR